MKLGLVRRSERASERGRTTDYMHSLLEEEARERASEGGSTFRKLVRAEGGASGERVCRRVVASVRLPLPPHSPARSPPPPGVSGRASPMYFLPWIEAINLLKCSWPDILLVPLIDGLLAGSLPPPSPSFPPAGTASSPSHVGWSPSLLSSASVLAYFPRRRRSSSTLSSSSSVG